MPPVTILLIEDSETFLHGLRSILRNEQDLQVVAAATCGEEAIEQAVRCQPRVAVVDLRIKWRSDDALPAHANGVRLVTELRHLETPPAVLVISFFPETLWVQQLADAGAGGYLSKDDKSDALVLAIRALAGGMTVWTPNQLELLRTNRLDTLTLREREVLALLDGGYTNVEIGKRLNITAGAVNKHVEHVFSKLHAHTRTEAAKKARERGLLGGN